jgi:hypothetical protein|tara:strand:- start:297 stop:425 length:129 start_codon:yes stop_codon:yes gene_type:complete
MSAGQTTPLGRAGQVEILKTAADGDQRQNGRQIGDVEAGCNR